MLVYQQKCTELYCTIMALLDSLNNVLFFDIFNIYERRNRSHCNEGTGSWGDQHDGVYLSGRPTVPLLCILHFGFVCVLYFVAKTCRHRTKGIWERGKQIDSIDSYSYIIGWNRPWLAPRSIFLTQHHYASCRKSDNSSLLYTATNNPACCVLGGVT